MKTIELANIKDLTVGETIVTADGKEFEVQVWLNEMGSVCVSVDGFKQVSLTLSARDVWWNTAKTLRGAQGHAKRRIEFLLGTKETEPVVQVNEAKFANREMNRKDKARK